MAEATFRFAVAGEDDRHFQVATTIIDGQLRTIDWLEPVLDSIRSWSSRPDGPERYMKLSGAREWTEPVVEIDGRRIRMQGHIGGQPLKPEAGMWRKVLAMLASQDPRPRVVVLVRDLDGQPARRDGMLQARDKLPWPADMSIVLATPEPEMEGWVVSGFKAETREEQRCLEEQTRALSFDPTLESHRLTSHPNDAPSDAKRVLDALTHSDVAREERCLADRDLLYARGYGNYCSAFLDEVRACVMPLFP